MRIEPNAHVVIEYTLRNDAGDILDTSDADDGQPMIYVHGYGMIVPGLEKALTGLEVGAKKTIDVTPDEGFGEHDEELVMEIDRGEAPRPKTIAVGDELVMESPEGDEAVVRVINVTEDTVTLDGNHPLAGMNLHYEVHVREIRAATEAEIHDAASVFDDARDDYEPAPKPPNLVQLGQKGGKKNAKRQKN
jgi:FKBP-type peptidyl-prolyl cis-trans isomerase SlyD